MVKNPKNLTAEGRNIIGAIDMLSKFKILLCFQNNIRLPVFLGCFRWVILISYGLLSQSYVTASEQSSHITSLKEYFDYSGRPGMAQQPVSIEAIVTYVDPRWKLLFLEDSTGGCMLKNLTQQQIEINPGIRVLIQGLKKTSNERIIKHELKDVILQQMESVAMPCLLITNTAQLFVKSMDSRRVEVQGTIRFIAELSRLKLILQMEKQRFAVWVRQHQPADLTGLLDAEITCQAICNQYNFSTNGQAQDVDLLVEDFRSLQIKRPGSDDPYAITKTSVQQLQALKTNDLPKNRILIQGSVIDQELGTSLRLNDGTGEILVQSSQGTALVQNDIVDVIGFASRDNSELILSEAMYRVRNVSRSGTLMAAQANPELPKLTSLKQILDLTRDQARQCFPLQVTGVVTHFDAAARHLFVQEKEQAIFVELNSTRYSLKRGDLVEIVGVTKPGGVLTMIIPAMIKVIGSASIPPASYLSYSIGMSGYFDCQRVKTKGVIQSLLVKDQYLNMDLVTLDGRYHCTVPELPGSSLQSVLLNSVIEIEGVCILNVDEHGLASSVQISAQEENDITILESAPTDEFSARLERIGDVLRFLSPQVANRRIKVRGVVTLWRPGHELYLQDESGAIRAQTWQTNRLEIGDEIEVVGFRSQGQEGTILYHAEYHVIGKYRQLRPFQIDIMQVLNSTNHGMLIQLNGRLMNDVNPSAAPELVFEEQGQIYTATLEPLEPGKLSPLWKANSFLSVSGICFLRMDESRTPRAFRILARSLDDIVVMQQPPWFTAEKVRYISLILLVIVFSALGWIIALRKQVSIQTIQIQHRMKAEAAIQHRLALIWEHSTDGMILTNGEGVVVQVNDAYCRIVHKNREDLEGHSYLIAFSTNDPQNQMETYKERFARHIITPRHEAKLVLWNGESAWFDLSNMFLESPGTSPLLLSQYRNITDKKQAEEEQEKLREQLIQAQKTESIGRLAGGVAHDFNNMLQVILGNTMLILEEVPANSKIHESLMEIQKSAERSAGLTRQLLAFARKQTIVPIVLDLNDTVASLLKMIQRLIGENIQLIWMPGADLWLVKIDPAQIDQIMVNLCVNARDAIEGTGKITIKTANTTITEEYAQTHPECAAGDYVMLSIADSGHGIDPHAMPHLFEPFYTTKQVGKGTGLGLATVFGIVKQNQGFIEVQSEPGNGAAFSIFLPRSGDSVAVTSVVTPKISLFGKETVLLVEDEEQILNLGCRILRQFGYHVLAAQNPDAALALASDHGRPIDLLITDIVMPRMNGKELLGKIQTIHPGIKCIFISGYTADVIANQGFVEEGLHFIAKPFSLQTLTEKVRNVLKDNC